jgi:pimeloyl-ACP methyl ester carboxylesterase
VIARIVKRFFTHCAQGIAALTICASSVLGPGAQGQSIGIQDAHFVSLGGIEQWVTVRSDDSNNPVLLVVHGGPGDVLSPYVSEFAPYESEFTVVQWDQRGAGRTFGRYREQTPELTLDRAARDGVELAEYFLNRLDKKKLIVLGHSWGSLIAVEMAKLRPELFVTYVGTGQISSSERSNQAQYDYLVARAEQAGDSALRTELESIGAFDPTSREHSRLVNGPLRRNLNDSDTAWLGNLLNRARELYTPSELEDASGGMRLSGRAYSAIQPDLFTTAPTLNVPVVIIQGRDDWFTPTRPAMEYFEFLRAPQKRFIVIDGAAHFALVTHQSEFLNALRETVRPMALAEQ